MDVAQVYIRVHRFVLGGQNKLKAIAETLNLVAYRQLRFSFTSTAYQISIAEVRILYDIIEHP